MSQSKIIGNVLSENDEHSVTIEVRRVLSRLSGDGAESASFNANPRIASDVATDEVLHEQVIIPDSTVIASPQEIGADRSQERQATTPNSPLMDTIHLGPEDVVAHDNDGSSASDDRTVRCMPPRPDVFSTVSEEEFEVLVQEILREQAAALREESNSLKASSSPDAAPEDEAFSLPNSSLPPTIQLPRKAVQAIVLARENGHFVDDLDIASLSDEAAATLLAPYRREAFNLDTFRPTSRPSQDIGTEALDLFEVTSSRKDIAALAKEAGIDERDLMDVWEAERNGYEPAYSSEFETQNTASSLVDPTLEFPPSESPVKKSIMHTLEALQEDITLSVPSLRIPALFPSLDPARSTSLEQAVQEATKPHPVPLVVAAPKETPIERNPNRSIVLEPYISDEEMEEVPFPTYSEEAPEHPTYPEEASERNAESFSPTGLSFVMALLLAFAIVGALVATYFLR
ncbi:MAG: hypothetical protein EP343_18985 [Deltaproteobacteria bacterium]|nr:MAG: hypothetical protein EP343_18985 [Deltaproteobacteria bacterium]